MKPRIILADLDESYMEILEFMLLKRYEYNLDLIEITNDYFFQKYFSEMVSASVLVVSEDMYTNELCRHNLDKIIILSEKKSSAVSKKTIYLNRYGNIKNILNEIEYSLNELFFNNTKTGGTRVIGVTSAVGGSGKTTIAMGLCQKLSRMHKRVFYLNVQKIQSFQYYLKDKRALSRVGCKELRSNKSDCYEKMKYEFRKEEFTYCPPLAFSRESQMIPFSAYNRLIEQICKSGEYDYIITDMDNGCDSDNVGIISLCDHVLIIVLQDDYSLLKTDFLQKNMDCSDHEKFIFICNRSYEITKKRMEKDAENRGYQIGEYIEDIASINSIQDVIQSKGIENIAYMLL